ncbi:MAG: oxygen-independent coproporphyrinogen III oxidase [Burkholderiales bacterium]
MSAILTSLPVEVDLDLIRRLDRNGPRYTSYPTADRLTQAFGPDTYKAWVARRNIGSADNALSIYVHLPFCSNVCFYCACNKVITANKARGVEYLRYLTKEIELQSALFKDTPRVEQMHWGGGTPTFFNNTQLAELYGTLRRHFEFAPEGEYSIEIDPRTVSEVSITGLREMGFNRVSLGVQDFDPDVQRAVNRVQSEEQTLKIIAAARQAGFHSINIDLIYGLPRQSQTTFDRTLERVIATKPDRIAIYNYAHLPSRFKPQRFINVNELPAPEVKLKLLGLSVQRLTEAGYVYIGMDHFARQDDSLAEAQRQRRLHRNFQGYSTHAECDLVSFGVSAIGAIGPTYSQNTHQLPDYYDHLDRDLLPIIRGIELSPDDLIRRAVIQALMCQFELSTKAIETEYSIDFEKYFCEEITELLDFAQSGMIEFDGGHITVTPKGRMLIRNICMVFDRYLRETQTLAQYSRVI